MERVYFTWPDRRLRYDCRGCGACCKGHGIGFDAAGGELVRLLARRPALAAFVRRRGDATTAFNPRDRCWFLDDGGLCAIEVEDGRAAKPASCRLFPFNRVFRIGSYTVVDLHAAICPLEVGDGDGGVAHAGVLAEIRAIADPAVIGSPLAARDPEAEGARLVEGERAIAAAAFAAAARAGTDPDAALAAAWGAQADLAALADERSRAIAALDAIVGAPWRAPSPPTLAAALWLTPSLRFNELYGPRQYAPRSRAQPVLARMWLAWLGFAALGEQLARRPLGLQALAALWAEQAPLMHAAARWADTPSLRASTDPGVERPGVDPDGLVRALAAAFVANRAAPRPFGALLAAWSGAADPAARVAALKAADAVMRAGFAHA